MEGRVDSAVLVYIGSAAVKDKHARTAQANQLAAGEPAVRGLVNR